MSPEEQALTPTDVRAILSKHGLLVGDQNWNRLEQWVEMLDRANQQVNLISRSEIPMIWGRHLLPCLALLVMRQIPEGICFCDFGAGGGLPGVPLAVCRPDLLVTLLDARRKKIRVLEEMIRDLGLKNAEPVWGRGEVLGKSSEYHKGFPMLCARAVASLTQLELWTRDLRADNAQLHVFKGGELDREFQQLRNNCPGVEWEQTLLDFPEYPFFTENKKYLVTLRFHST